ncbi:conserved hypothetical protein [Ricinus communis]|uniref:RNase H type-1 domain-containing protein n=1 Tax=Ricinus communis TaxID=3988 RepID=B9SZN3_RICCO|nr:conserved hypothetical protein [Ricinus communis]
MTWTILLYSNNNSNANSIPPSWVKINFDPATNANSSNGRIGFVVKDHLDSVIHSQLKVHFGQLCPLTLESLALRDAVFYAAQNISMDSVDL